MALSVVAVFAAPSSAATFENTTPIVLSFQAPPPGCPGPEGCRGDQADPYPSTIAVAGTTGLTTDVNVTLHDFSHVRPSDVDVLLQAPDGRTVILMSDACSAAGAFDAEDPITTPIDLTFDDEAASQLPADTTCFSGTFLPVDDDDDTNEVPTFIAPADGFPMPGTCNDEPPLPCGPNVPQSNTTDLSTLEGIQPNGSWNLYVVNDGPGGPDDFFRGQFAGGWSLDITTDAPTSTSTSMAPTTTTEPTTDGIVVDIDDTVLSDGTRGQVRGTITCEAGDRFVVDVDDLTQGGSSASGKATGTCSGSPQPFVINFTTAGPSFSDGAGEACVSARTGQVGSRTLTDSAEVCEDVTIDVRSS